jgi:hypothetical protein
MMAINTISPKLGLRNASGSIIAAAGELQALG